MSKIINPTFGSDPEVFVFSEKENKIVSSIGLVGGTKEEPRPIKYAPGFYVQEDNVLAEFNIPPSADRLGFVSAIHTGIDLISKELPIGYKVKIKPSHTFEPEQLAHPKAKELGCDPDWNAWTNTLNNPPDIMETPNLRSGGGHVIVGYKNPDYDLNILLVRLMDLFLGVPSVILDRDTERRKLYGKAGAFRHKTNIGVEYRTLSSFWLSSPELTGWVYDNTNHAIDAVNNEKLEGLEVAPHIIECINNGDTSLAELIVNTYNIPMP